MSIIVENLSKSFGKIQVLKGVTFSVPKSTVVGFLGPNGAGKTTSLRILSGYILPDTGKAIVNDFNVVEQSISVRKTLGYLPENNPLYPDQYVREFLAFIGSIHGLRGTLLKQRIESVIEMTGLGDFARKQVGALSKGYRQRVGLSASLIHNPQTLILDEPTTGLDPNQVVEIRELIKSLGKEKTVLFSSHILPEVEAVASHVILINKGEIILDKPLSALQKMGTNSQSIQLKFSNPDFDTSIISGAEGVIEVQKIDSNTFEIKLAHDKDIRRLIYDESIRQNNPIVTMGSVQDSLESVFRNLTQNSVKE